MLRNNGFLFNLNRLSAQINVAQYNNNKMGATGTDLAKCLASYISALEESGIKVDINPEDVVVEPSKPDDPAKEVLTAIGNIADIRTAVINGDSYYYIRLDSGASYFSIAAADQESVVILNVGDSVTVTYEGSGAIIEAESIQINGND